MKRGPTSVIEVYYDPLGTSGGRQGCIRARLRGNKCIHDAGLTRDIAVRALIVTAATFGYSADARDYRRVAIEPLEPANWPNNRQTVAQLASLWDARRP